MRTALDSNILSALWSNEPTAAVVARKLAEAKRQGSLVLSPVAYAELFAHPLADEAFREDFYRQVEIVIDFEMTAQAWAETGRRFAQYATRRRRSRVGEARRLVPDFAVGAHALLYADRLMTNDIDRYDRDFPELMLMKLDE
jgi:predicted nucleic acid-binding protein